jgi:hypothetical protein
MKKFFLLAGMAAMMATTVVTFDSCKKGAEDPAISLRSRKARLVGDWKLTKGTTTQTSQSGTITTTTYDGTNETTGSSTSPYTMAISFAKDGTYKATITSTQSSSFYSAVTTQETTGTWDFNAGIGDVKAKTIVSMHPTTETTTTVTTITGGGGTQTTNTQTTNYTSSSYASEFTLLELSNKELHITANDESTGGNYSNTKNDYTFTAQ